MRRASAVLSRSLHQPYASEPKVRFAGSIQKMMPWLWRRRLSYDERFATKIDKTDTCWLWKGGKDKDGYGMFNGRVDGVLQARAHRYSYARYRGPIPSLLNVCHTCDARAVRRPRSSVPRHDGRTWTTRPSPHARRREALSGDPPQRASRPSLPTRAHTAELRKITKSPAIRSAVSSSPFMASSRG